MPESHSLYPPEGVHAPAAHGEGVGCPRCGNAELRRIRRRPLDRLISWVRPVYRFRCTAFGCDWEGTLPKKWFIASDWRRGYYRY